MQTSTGYSDMPGPKSEWSGIVVELHVPEQEGGGPVTSAGDSVITP